MLFVMADIEKRRLKLLQETRKNYSDKYTPPAIHPRFRNAYTSLYGMDNDENIKNRSTFFVRALIAVIIFTFIYIMDYRNETIGNMSSQFVISEVQRTLLGQ